MKKPAKVKMDGQSEFFKIPAMLYCVFCTKNCKILGMFDMLWKEAMSGVESKSLSARVFCAFCVTKGSEGSRFHYATRAKI